MNKLLNTGAAILLAITASAQSFQTYTNAQLDSNTVAASSSNPWSTNTVDVTRYSHIVLTASGAGSAASTNTGTFSFLASSDNATWETVPRFALTFNCYGTNIWSASSNVDVRDIGYLKPYRVASSATNSQTNVTFTVKGKNYPRN
jgi:hypothetical protein